MDDDNGVIIDVSTFDPHFRDEVAAEPGGEHIRRCYSCGTCTAGCPVGGVTDKYNPRRIVHMALLGMREQVLSSELIWLCCQCNSCYFVCPQGIRLSRIATELQKIAVAEGYVDESFLKRLAPVNDYLTDLCRRTMFDKVKQGLRGPQTMPCWQKNTCKE
jgi:heterodisulfide reductase subunit C